MMFKIIIKLFGGFWKVKTLSLKSRFFRRLYYYCDNQCFWIGHSSKFEGIPILPHGFSGIFISNAAKIGKNVVIFQQVTIGSNTLLDSKRRGSPVLGDNVYIGAGAKIIGKVIIGNNVRIGANAVVTKDIPENCLVVGNNNVIYKKNKNNNNFYPMSVNSSK